MNRARPPAEPRDGQMSAKKNAGKPKAANPFLVIIYKFLGHREALLLKNFLIFRDKTSLKWVY